MPKYECELCGYVYDPDTGVPDDNIPAGTAFDDLPDGWTCPDCGADKSAFAPADD
jgi:rubredoxin